MIYFNPMPETLEGLKKLYRKLSREHHPDVGGSDEIMKLINREYTELFKELKDIHIDSNGEKYRKETKETPEQLIELMNRLNKAQKWVDSAENDLLEAEYIESMYSDLFSTLWQHCREAVVKYLKALIVFKCKIPPVTKNMSKLIEICEKSAKINLTYIYKECERLANHKHQEYEFDDSYNASGQILKDTERIKYFVTSYLEEFLIGKFFEIYFIK
ncbi:MAG: HEPN domain-containing protein [Oscillospiraceae bacterium]|nr:HEPN domain-containing protein [Oscillospiraceae bacterium]